MASAVAEARKALIARAHGKMLEAKAIKLLERRYQVWEMRKNGLSMLRIAETLGISPDQVRMDLMAIAKRLISELDETVEETRRLQVERLDALLLKYIPLAEAGNLSAASMVLQIEARRAKLLALDVPEKRQLEVSGVREYIGVNLDEV